MSEFLVYLSDQKGLVGYRLYTLHGIGLSFSDTLFERSISQERNQRQVREEESRSSALELLARQTREREERARELAEIHTVDSEKLKKEQEREKEAKIRELQVEKEVFNKEMEKQKKAREEEKTKKQQELRQQQIKMKELQEKLDQEKVEKTILEKEKAQNDFTSREDKLLDSIRQTEIAISKLQAGIQESKDWLTQKSTDTMQSLESIKRNQELILKKEEEIFKLQKRCESTEKLRQEEQAAYKREEKERQKEEAETQLAKLETMLRVADGNLMRKWYSMEFESLKEKVKELRQDFERGNYETVRISFAKLAGDLESIDQKIYADEKMESRRECVAISFLKTLRYRCYKTNMFQNDPKDARSSVVIRGESPSGFNIEIILPFKEVYSIKFTGMKEQKCCSEESAIREVMQKFGISWQALDPLESSFLKKPSPAAQFEFRDGDKRVKLTKQICG